MNYQPSPWTDPGTWNPVETTFSPQSDGSYVEDRSAVTVKVSSAGVETTDRASGSGIRWIVPSQPVVSATAATVIQGGVSWTYLPTGAGLSFSAIISQSQGAKTWSFPYRLLGGAQALATDPRGRLVSDHFAVSPATVVGADGRIYPAGSWRLLGGNIAAFSIDDSAFAASAYPYLIDPDVIYQPNGAQWYSSEDTVYPPQGGITQNDGSSWVQFSDCANCTAGLYTVSDAVLTWDTSALPANATTFDAAVYIWSCVSQQQDANMNLYLDWVSGQPLGTGMYPPNAYPNALSNQSPYPQHAISSLGSSNNVSSCLSGNTGGNESVIWMDGPQAAQGVGKAGTSALRFKAGNSTSWPSSPAPTGLNYAFLVGPIYQDKPLLVVNWYVPVPAPTQNYPVAAAVYTLTPALSVVGESDPDGDAVYYRYSLSSNWDGSNPLWSTGWASSNSVYIPPNILGWDRIYYWQACAWDGVDPNGANPSSGGLCNTWSSVVTRSGHYRIDLKAWIPQYQVVDPLEPTKENYPGLEAVRFPNCYTPPGDAASQALNYRVITHYLGNNHLQFDDGDGSYKVQASLEFDWNGQSIQNARMSPDAPFEMTHLVATYYDSSGNVVANCEMAHATATQSVTVGGAGSSFNVSYTTKNPLSAPQDATPSIDGQLTGLINPEGQVQITWSTTNFPSQGVRVSVDGIQEYTSINDVGCLGETGVNGFTGLANITLGLNTSTPTATAVVYPEDFGRNAIHPTQFPPFVNYCLTQPPGA